MKVYIVEYDIGYDCGYQITEVFATKELAEKYIEEVFPNHNCYDITEWDIKTDMPIF